MKKKVLLLIAMGAMHNALNAQSGNVGIGTNTPASKLTVNGNASVGSGYTGTAAPANGAIIEGNTGIGTTTPGTNLQVVGGIAGGTAFGVSGTAPVHNIYLELSGNTSLPAPGANGQILFVKNNTGGSLTLSKGYTGGLYDAYSTADVASVNMAPSGHKMFIGFIVPGFTGWIAQLSLDPSFQPGNFWNTLGNTGTNSATNFLGTSDNASLSFRTNNIQRMYVDSAKGFVGVGTAAPLANTHIINTGTDGAFVAVTGHTNNMAQRLENTGNGQAVIQHFVAKNTSGATKQMVMGINPNQNSDGVFVIARDTTIDFLMDLNNGNFGIGTFPNIHTRFDIAANTGTNEYPIARISNLAAAAAGNKAIIGFNSYNGGGANWGIGSEQESATSTDSRFHFYWSGGATYNTMFTIEPKNPLGAGSGANVGVNTENPNNDMDLGPTFGSSATDAAGKKLAVYNNAAGTDFYGLGINPGMLQFHAGAAPTATPGMVLTGSGRIGIGNTAPSYPLHVTGFVGADNFITTNAYCIGTLTPTHNLDLNSNLSSIANLHSFAPNLNGGIIQLRKNTAAVSGDVWMNFIANGATVGFISSNAATTVAYNTSSDIRLKENIKNTHFGIDDVMKIDVKDYNYKADADKTPQTGFIAQQLYTVFPNAVTKGGDDITKNPWAVDYGKVAPLLTKAIQDQQKMIEQLEAKVKMLETENQKLTTAAEEVSATKKAYAELAQEVKEMQQMLGISKITAGSKVATK